MKMQAFFDGVWAKAVAEFPDGQKSVESRRLFHAIVACIRAGEHDAGHIRNSLGYDTDLPSTEKDGKESIPKKVLFQKTFQRALNEVRLRVANASAGEVWGVNFIGHSASSLIMYYCNAVERDSDQVKFPAPKALKSRLKAAGFAEKNNFFTIPLNTYVTMVLDPVIPPKAQVKDLLKEQAELVALEKRTAEQESRLKELGEMIPVMQHPAIHLHKEFCANYRERLQQYTDLRSERMTAEFAEIADDFGAEW